MMIPVGAVQEQAAKNGAAGMKAEMETVEAAVLPEGVKPVTGVIHISVMLEKDGALAPVEMETVNGLQGIRFKLDGAQKVKALFIGDNGQTTELEAVQKTDAATGESYLEIPYVGEGDYVLTQAD